MAASTAATLSSLLQKSSLDDHEQLLAASTKALKSSKADGEAQRVKVVALIKLDRYDEAVQFIEATDVAVRAQVTLEYAYALYKTGRLEEAAKLASTMQAQSRGAQHLEAQARYRLEDARRTRDLYEQIRRQPHSAEEYDLRVNQGAIDAQSQWLGVVDAYGVRKPGREDLEAFETAYNAACGSITRGEYAQAEILLKRAKELCKHSDELTEAQKAEELLPIGVQQLYVLLRQGKTADAERVAAEIKAGDAADRSTRKIGENNVLLASSLANPFLAHKTFHTAPAIPPEDALFSYQSVPLDSNRSTLALQTFKFGGIIDSTAKVLSQSALPSLSTEVLLASFFNAAAHAQNEVGPPAIKKILPELEKRPNDVGLVITLVQLYVMCGNLTSAVDVVEALFRRLEASVAESEQEIRYHPVLVSLVISLYKQRGQRTHVKRELAQAASFWRTRAHAPTSLLTAAAVALLESHDTDEARQAADIFAQLREQQPHDRAIVAGYVASHVGGDGAAADADVAKLTPVVELTRPVDVDELEQAGIPQSANALAIAQLARTRKRAAADGANARPKRRRASRLPKDYDASKQPDPERWLPMRDRSYYRPPKGKKKGRRGDDRTQGGVVNEELDGAAKAPSAVPATSGSGGGGAGKKKKGKGKK